MVQYVLSQWAGNDLIAANEHHISGIGSNVLPNNTEQLYKQFPHKYGRILSENSESQYTGDLSQMHKHIDFAEIIYVYSGCGIAFLNETKRFIQKGDIICVQPGESHCNFALPDVKIYNCLISSSLIQKGSTLFQGSITESNRLRLVQFYRLRGDKLLEIEKIFCTMIHEYSQKPLFYEDAMLNCVNRFLIYLCRSQTEDKIQIHNQRTMAQLLDYITLHYTTVTLNDLAEFSSYSPGYLSRLFRDTFGFTFTEYVNRLRIDEAVKLILQTDMSIEDICLSVGFKSRMHFYDVFKKHTSFTPGTLRREK